MLEVICGRAPQELMTVDEQSVRLALLRKAFQSDWEGAAPTAPSSNGCAQTDLLSRAAVRLPPCCT